MPHDFMRIIETVTATKAEASLAKASSERLARYANRRQSLRIGLASHAKAEAILLPAPAVRLLVRLLSEMATGNAVALASFQVELTTQQAAKLLGVSRPFLIKQIEADQLPHRLIGTRRRILLKDLMDFKLRLDADRSKSLDELAAESQRLGLGY